MTAFASSDQIVLGRPLTDQEIVDAQTLLDRASRMVRRNYPNVDARILSGDLLADDVADVVCAMVERALNPRRGLESLTDTTGPYSITERYSNPDSGLYMTNSERAVFASEGAARRAFSIQTYPYV